MSEDPRSYRPRRGAGVVERGGLENRAPLHRLIMRLDAAGACLARFAGQIGRRGPENGFRWGRAGTARIVRACSAVQRTWLLRRFSAPEPATLPMVAYRWSRGCVANLFKRPQHAILLVTQAMGEDNHHMGFEAGDREIPGPPIPIDDETRDRMALALCVISQGDGATPEELAGYLEEGFPAWAHDALEREGEREEMHAHIDLLLHIQHALSEA